MLFDLLRIAVFAFLGRARGSRLYGKTTSTTVARVVSTLGMAITAAIDFPANFATGMFWLWASLMCWCVFGWDNYWSAAIGNPTNVTEKEFAPADWAMRKITARVKYFQPLYDAGENMAAYAGTLRLRLWGLVAMTLRQQLVVPAVVGYAIFMGVPGESICAAGALLLGLPYFIAGYFSKTAPITWAEAISTATIGAMLLGVANG